MNSPLRIARRLIALIVCCVAFGVTSVAAASATVGSAGSDPTAPARVAESTAKPPANVKLSAKLLDTRVKVNGKARIHGRLDVETPLPLASGVRRGLELIVVQELKAGVWVDLTTSTCRPNATFRLRVSFSLAAQYTLRVYHPATALYASASSETFVVAVVP
jgi:hypothetical protein